MRHALILAGGSGVRLWPMSRRAKPKQLIPFIGGRSLLQLAMARLDGLIPPERCYVCAGLEHREAVLAALPDLGSDRFLGEPAGRDTLNAVGFSAAVIGARDPEAAIAVFTADHLIRPEGRFREIVAQGYQLVEESPETLVTFGVEPTFPSTGYGYLQLGRVLNSVARKVEAFREKPDAAAARAYFDAGPGSYLWNSGMFVWRARTVLDCIRRYRPENHRGLSRIAEAWGSPDQESVVADVYASLEKISVDYAVMEPASRDSSVGVAAIPMNLDWMDVGSWLTFAQTCPADNRGNALAAERRVLEETSDTLVASSDPGHLIAVMGCEGLVVVHTPDATLVCRKDQAEAVRYLQQKAAELFGREYQ
ncbi:MAG TPA: mannose-1-phosphate guanylyltransferase [Bryobacteraceae bacterium]|nr:mannose-1-phosphate guanylyltransferase [Bryobacteraceae bacterium]